MNKKIIISSILVVVLIASSFMGCSYLGNKDEVMEAGSVKNVETLIVKSEKTPIEVYYTGIVIPDESMNYSFKSSGKINEIKVEKGDYIKKGQVLASMDKEDLLAQSNVSRNKYELAKLDLKKAGDALDYSKDNFENVKILYDLGSLAEDQYKGAKINFTNSEISYNQSKTQVELAKIDLDYKNELLNDSNILSEVDGYVVTINAKSGERVSAGMPIISVRNNKIIIKAGATQKDIKNFNVGADVIITDMDDISAGIVLNVSDIPDQMTRMYDVNIEIENQEILIGSIVDVSINTGMQEGIWIPIESILSSTVDYVYLIKDGLAFRKNIEIIKTNESNVMVRGLIENDQLVVKGMRGLKDGKKVSILNN